MVVRSGFKLFCWFLLVILNWFHHVIWTLRFCCFQRIAWHSERCYMSLSLFLVGNVFGLCVRFHRPCLTAMIEARRVLRRKQMQKFPKKKSGFKPTELSFQDE